MNPTATKRKSSPAEGMLPGILMVFAAMMVVGAMATGTVYGKADNFTDIFYTNSFRGAFEWIEKLDWVGMLVQIVISTFSLFGVALLTIRIMTSMLFLSAKGMWEEVHDLKSSGESAEKDFLGMFGMAKTWASGKSGTGLDAIVGAVLMILPDVKRYSDFGEKAGGDFSDDMTISQYMLKIALPTVMTVFFFAMGFNGTLFQALAVTVDAMGTLADRAISVNYAGIVDDLVNSQNGYKFYYDADGSSFGKMKQSMAKDLYGNIISLTRDATPDQLYRIGQWVEGQIDSNFADPSTLAIARGADENIKNGLQGENADGFVRYVEFDVVVSGNANMADGSTYALGKVSDMLASEAGFVIDENVARDQYMYIKLQQSSTYNGAYWNVGQVQGNNTNNGQYSGGNGGGNVTTPDQE